MNLAFLLKTPLLEPPTSHSRADKLFLGLQLTFILEPLFPLSVRVLPPYWFVCMALTKHHRPRGLNNRNLLPHSFLEAQCLTPGRWQGRVPFESSKGGSLPVFSPNFGPFLGLWWHDSNLNTEFFL